MACGTPVVETCAGAALLVDPEDPAALADAAALVLSDGARQDELRAAGLRRAGELTWERAARATDAVIDRVLERGRTVS
jgi:glycosyltransferase involved in cell wall biosynthesis